jgi:3-oxoadipate enol-lactonase
MGTGVSAVVDREADGFAWREHPGPPQGPTLVLLHGLMGSRLSWEPQLSCLGDTARVVAWDLPGYGDSAALPGPVSWSGLADAVVRLADTLGADAFHLAGISFGGMIAQYVAAGHPGRLRSLALLATSPCFGLDGTTPDDWRAARLQLLDSGQEPGDFARQVLQQIGGVNLSREALDEQVAAARRVSSAALRTSIDCLVTHDARPLLASITTPTLCLVGSLDDETPPSYSVELASGIPGARQHTIEDAGHLLNVEAPRAVNQHLHDHIEAHR